MWASTARGSRSAATCLLRDHRVTPIAQCGTDLLLLRIADTAVQGTALYPVQYDFYHTAEAFEGTRLILRGSSKKLARACQDGLTHFFYEGNPLIGMRRWAPGNALAIYDSKDGQGHLFYRNLKRGEIEGIPLVLVINKPTKTIENMIGRDRDRNAFGEPVLTLAYRQVAGALKWSHEAQRVVVESARGVWERGHPLLAAIADKIRGYHWQNPHWPREIVRRGLRRPLLRPVDLNHADGAAGVLEDRAAMEGAGQDAAAELFPEFRRHRRSESRRAAEEEGR